MTFFCPTCGGKGFGSQHKHQIHSQIHSDQILTCKICEKSLIGIMSFNNHIKIYQTYECENCEGTLKVNSRSAHMKVCCNEVLLTLPPDPIHNNLLGAKP